MNPMFLADIMGCIQNVYNQVLPWLYRKCTFDVYILHKSHIHFVYLVLVRVDNRWKDKGT